MSLDLLIVLLIVLCALAYFGKRVYTTLKGSTDCGCGCGKNCCSKQKRP